VGQPLPSIILISVDTLRADRLSCYGYRGRPTPHIDAIAKGGTLFSQVSSQAPLTLPSHVSLLTSSYPFSNGITDNGQQLGPNAVTLATLLKSRGYRTAAFVGGFVLDRRFGLNQGFDFYDSPFDLHRRRGIDPGDVKRLGEEVVRAANHWLEENSSQPFFLFLHLYDLHTPYDLPAALRQRFPGPGYEAELAYVDEVLGGFWSALAQQRLLEKALVVFTSDHGESLGDHGESTHGYFIYQSTLRVPLIIHWPSGSKGFAARVDEPASLLDVAPTILQFAGIARPSEFQGRSLLGWSTERPPGGAEEVYSESLYARNHFGCSSLQSLRLGRYKYIEAPRPEFYDLAKDPGETQNLYPFKKSLALSLRERLQALRSRFRVTRSAESRTLSPEAVAALNSLGYVAVSHAASNPTESRPDPKDRIADSESYSRALALVASGRLTEANLRLEQLRTKFPEVIDIRLSLGVNQQRLKQHKEATENFRQALKQDPLCVLAHFNLAVSYSELQQLDDAIKELQAVLAIAPYYTRADELLGTLWLQKKDYERARAHFNHLLATAPEDYTAHYNLGVLATLEGKWSEGERHLRSALATDPKSAEAYNSLGSLYLRSGDLDRARQALAEAIRLEPKFAWARYNLGLVFRQQKRNDEAAREFREALVADPKFQAAREALDHLERP
jgi:arylsulfatase A-like enzyme/Tfp pilus assembly protein PilF